MTTILTNENDIYHTGALGETVFGAGGNDWLTGGLGDDMLLGGSGDDLLSGGGGRDQLYGGSGNDTVSYSYAAHGVTADLATGVADLSYVDSSTADFSDIDQLSGIENLTGSNHADRLSGDAAANILHGLGGYDELNGGGGMDELFGGAGNDELNGGGGADHLDGGTGFDAADYSGSAAGVTMSLSLGFAGIGGDALNDTLVGIEELRGSGFADQLTGDGGSNHLHGNGGADALDGRSGHDWLLGGDDADSLHGGIGDDILAGGAGADLIHGGVGNDIADYRDSAAAVIVNLETGEYGGGDATGDTLVNIDGLYGSEFADKLTGDTYSNTLGGGEGNDKLSGMNGADRLEGSAGDDRLNGGAQDDSLIGGAGDDMMAGGDGGDLLIGSVGRDDMRGGTGADTFDFSAWTYDTGNSAASADLIRDFQVGIDTINLARDAEPGADFFWIGTAAFSGEASEVRTFQAGGNTYVEADTNGDGAGDFQIKLTGALDLSSGDFIL